MQTENQQRTIGRAAEDFQQKLLGRQPLRFTFEIVPKSVDGLPPSVEAVSVVWEKGAKLSYTDPCAVDSHGQARFSQIMRQTATMYKQQNSLLPKEYTFKVQTVRQGSNKLLSSSETRRKTIARAKLNLADYCTPGAAAPATAEVSLPLQPQGKLQLAIRAVWLQHSSKGNAKLDRASEQGSITDISSHYSSETDSAYGDEVNRTASLDLDQLADYAASSQTCQTTKMSEALTAERAGSSPSLSTGPVRSSSYSQPQRQVGPLPPAGAAGAASHHISSNESHGAASRGPQHRRTISLPDHPITTILEAEREGLEVAGSIERSASGKYSAVAAAVAAAHEELQLDLAAATLAEEEGADGLRSLSSHLPAWLWPFSRDAVRGVTTDELMRQIAAANDVGKLQQLCKGLLCERNDWRYKATQLDRNVNAMQLQLEKMQVANTNLLQQLEHVESQVSQLQQDTLVDRLVEAKLQLAQADLQATALRGQLNKERERSRQWAAKFTDLEVLYESLLEQEATRQGSSCPPGFSTPHTPEGDLSRRLYVDVGGAASGAATPSGEQGEGLSGAAAAAGTVAAGLVRKISHTGWGGLGGLMRSGASLVAAGPGGGGADQELPRSSSRRASTPSGEGSVTNELSQTGPQQRSARHSIA